MLASKGIPIEERTGDDVVHSISQASVVSDHSAASLSRSFHEKSGLLDGSFSSRYGGGDLHPPQTMARLGR